MLKKRILTAIVALVALLLVLFALPAPLARAVIVLVVLAGAWEWGGLLGQGVRNDGFDLPRVAYTAAIAALIGTLFWLLASNDVHEIVLKAALVWWFAALLWMFAFPTPIPAWLSACCGALVLVPAWLALDQLYLRSAESLLTVLLIVWIADIGAYFVGKRFGRVKLAPAVSPGKSWEGALGGLTLVALFAVLATMAGDGAITVLMPFFVAVAMVSIIGDLTVSMFKRNAGVKDSGRLFPGHGGVLDRIDSVTAAAPLFSLGLMWIGL